MKTTFETEVVAPERASAPRKGILSRLPELPRLSDSAQKRAGGNIVKFMAGLIVLTLIARGTSGATLAKVDVQNPARGEITEAITATASVTARDTFDITAPEGLTVEQMLVGAGQTIKVGEAITVFDIDEVTQKLERESANLDKMLLELAKIEREDSIDRSALESAQRNLERARADYESTRAQGESDVADAWAALDEALAQLAEPVDSAALESAQRSLERAKDDYNSTKAQGESDIADAQSVLDKVLAGELEIPDASALESAQRSLKRAQEDYDAVAAQGESDVAAAQRALDAAVSNEQAKYYEWLNAAAADKAAAELAYLAAQADSDKARDAITSAHSRASENLQSAQRRVEDAQTSYNKAKQDYEKNSQQTSDSFESAIEKAEAALESARAKADESRLSALRRVEDAESALAKAEKDFDKAITQASDSVRIEIEKAQSALESATAKAADNLQSSRRRVEDAQVSLDKAEQDYEKSVLQAGEIAAQNSASAVMLRMDIDVQQQLVDELRLLVANDGVLYADVAGTVSGAVSEGSVTDKGVVVSFLDGAKGFEAKLQLTKTEADRLAVGDVCEVTTGGGSMYYTPTVTGTVSGISQPDQNDIVAITVRLPGSDWTNGQRVDVRAVNSRATYDMCVPLSALRSNSSGYYLLAVEHKSTVLGAENVVVRVPVTVSALGESLVAVQGPLDRFTEIVTGSSKSIEPGDRVRVNTK